MAESAGEVGFAIDNSQLTILFFEQQNIEQGISNVEEELQDSAVPCSIFDIHSFIAFQVVI